MRDMSLASRVTEALSDKQIKCPLCSGYSFGVNSKPSFLLEENQTAKEVARITCEDCGLDIFFANSKRIRSEWELE